MSVIIAQENTPITLCARIIGQDGDAIQQADISAISAKVYDVSDTATPIATLTPVVANAITDTLQDWDVDDTGYNFSHTLPASALPDGETYYDVEYKFTPASGDAFYIVFHLLTTGIISE